jgi:hypothetical protein
VSAPANPIEHATAMIAVALPIVQARLHRKARNLVAARDRGNMQIVAAMQEEVVTLTELTTRMEAWLDEFDPLPPGVQP